MSGVSDFLVQDLAGNLVPFDKYSGLVLIIVNFASYCGLTNSNFNEMKSLNDKYYNRGLRVAAFPCNRVGYQALPVCEEDARHFEFMVNQYGKVLVNGVPIIGKEDPLWRYLRNDQAATLFNARNANYNRFLVNRKGKVLARHDSSVNSKSFEEEVVKLLDQLA